MEEKMSTGFRSGLGEEIFCGDEVIYDGDSYIAMEDKNVGWVIHPAGSKQNTEDYPLADVWAEVEHATT